MIVHCPFCQQPARVDGPDSAGAYNLGEHFTRAKGLADDGTEVVAVLACIASSLPIEEIAPASQWAALPTAEPARPYGSGAYGSGAYAGDSDERAPKPAT